MSSKMDEKEKKAYVSLYKKDGLSYSLTLLAIVAELVYVISILDVIEVSFWMGPAVMINIVMLFALFTCAVKMNIYEKKLAFAAVGLGIYMILRQAVFVPFILKPYSRQMIIMAANAAGTCLLVAAGFISIHRTNRRQKLQEKLDSMGEGLEMR
ncbi:hypothetical protein C0033_18565 [Clostridium sp. chh4-2]|uniref:hypothetical protein n=1 Tax=Clostridium sp. chh4-2 TaxID=2067550 RepID=UPI000CCE43EA|nr:hypothetical protein [Clostridium sp. chh4-2]PNV60521.1 hypothetical protein C0033_18565 [Clostridium sp. chh4-2]